MYDTGYSPIVDASGRPYTMAESQSPLHEAASTGERLGNWGLNYSGPTASVYPSIKSLRARARESYRNNPLAHGGVDSLVANMVGTDISPRWKIKNLEQKEELQELWSVSVEEMDYDGVSDFYGQQDIAAHAMVIDGESLAHFIDMPPDYGLTVPFQVKQLEADHLDAAYNGISPETGNEIRYGIEWADGKRIAYWLDRDHPGESFLLRKQDQQKMRVPVDDMAHVFRPTRPGQARGCSWMATVLIALKEIDQYNDAELVRKKVSALWGGFIYTDSSVPQPRQVNAERLGGKVTNKKPVRSMELRPGSFPVLEGDQRVQFHDTADVGASYIPFLKTQFRIIAKGLGITYEQLSGDLEGVSFSSIRAGLIEFRRLIDSIRLRTLIHQFCRPVAARWVRAAVLNRVTTTISPAEYLANPKKFTRIDWMPDAWEFVNPLTDRAAVQMDIRNGISSRTAEVARQGRDVEQVDAENAADAKRAKELGLVYDSDPSQVNKGGTVQKAVDSSIAKTVAAD